METSNYLTNKLKKIQCLRCNCNTEFVNICYTDFYYAYFFLYSISVYSIACGLSVVIFTSILTDFPFPGEEKHNSLILPPIFFDVGMVCSGCDAVLIFLPRKVWQFWSHITRALSCSCSRDHLGLLAASVINAVLAQTVSLDHLLVQWDCFCVI